MEIFVSGDLTETQVARLREDAGADTLHVHGYFSEDAGLEPSFANCEVVFGNVPASWLMQSKALRWVQLDSVGFGEYRDLDWRQLGKEVTVTNLAGFFAQPVAETALAGILALYRGIDRLVRLQSAGDWQGDPLRKRLHTLAGANVVLFGYGSINRCLAAMLHSFGCNITNFGRGWTAEHLDGALSEADIVVSAVPETNATIGLFDAARLSLLKPTALFVNLGRGSVVAEDALARRLREDRLAGAVIDVTSREPLPPGHEFWTCPNLILTQHTAGGTEDEIDRKIEAFADNLARYRNGKPLVGIVDFEKGY
jgi:phosphoglycerate dehydrogenase-like enzyme